MNYQDLTQLLIKRCLARGADQAEVFLETGRQLSLEIRNGQVETVQEAAAQGAGLRVFVQGRMGFCSCNDLSEQALDAAIRSAVGLAKNMTSDPSHVLPQSEPSTDVPGLYDPEIARVPMDTKIELAKAVERLALKDPRITKSAGSAYGEGFSEVFIANSLGLAKSFKSSACFFRVEVVAEKGEQKSSGGDFCARRFFADLKKPEEVAAKAARDAYEMLDPRMVNTQRAAVIFHPDAAGALLGGILAATNGERVLQGTSFLAGSLNGKIGSDLLTIVDDGTRPKGMASRPFDGEGVPTEKRTVIDRGVLRGFMYNTVVGKKAGVKSTGNASRGDFQSLPDIGGHNFFLAAGGTPPEEIIRATQAGLLLKEVTGYGINPVTGQFSGGASGLWIENGRVSFPVKGLTVAGTAAEMFNGLDLVGNDLDLNLAFSAPTFRIVSLQIGGE
ncbi:MAG: TldD/PmbA family protein [Candidatus Aminicenantes bacterium]|nr:TldD/PmbA family protein [Candidatus Aminicenantes bacterium]